MLRFLLPNLLLIACGDKQYDNQLEELDIREESEPSGDPIEEPSAEPEAPIDPLISDDDGDGFSENDGDCDDTDPSVHPDADEYCDGVDSNCNDIADENPVDGFDYYLDVDSDGFGAGDVQGAICELPQGYADNALDCNDGDPEINPEKPEICGDGLDNNCNDEVDDGPPWYEDADEDGFGDISSAISQCEQPAGYVEDNTDCNPTNGQIYPSAPEIAGDGIDQDCDGLDALPYAGTEQFIYSMGSASTGSYDCDLYWTATGAISATSCADCTYTFDINLSFDSAASTVDSSCSSIAADNTYTYGFIEDYDGNGNGALLMYDAANGWQPWIVNGTISGNNTDLVTMAGGTFSYQTGYLDYQYQGGYDSYHWIGNGALLLSDIDRDGFSSDIDCDDNDATSTTTLSDEDCDSILTADDCDDTDSALGSLLADIDCDGLINTEDCEPENFSTASSIQDADCDGTLTADDCDDNDPTRYIGAVDIPYDGTDQDCDGQDAIIDQDSDGDSSLTDCDDTNPAMYTGATDIPNDGVDQDCSGSDSTVAVDNDGDGEDTMTDCDDNDPAVYTGAAEILNDGIDQDCDGQDSTTPYAGTEVFYYADNEAAPSSLACALFWDLAGSPSSISCADCAFVFDMTLSYDTSSLSAAACSATAVDNSYTYGFIADYDGAGNSALSIYDATNGWTPWIVNGTSNPDGSTDIVSLVGSSFTYSSGYQDYQYQGYYHTYYWLGNATLEGTDADGDGALDLVDCDDTDAGIFIGAPEIANDGIDQDCDGADLISLTYIGTEDFTYADANPSPSTHECEIHWDVMGTTSSTACSGCDYTFDMLMTYDTTSLAGASCSNLATDQSYTYGFTADYDGNGNASVSYYAASNGWTPWIVNGTSNPDGSTDIVSLVGSSFTYSSGYQDYQYQGYYYTYYWLGSGTAQ